MEADTQADEEVGKIATEVYQVEVLDGDLTRRAKDIVVQVKALSEGVTAGQESVVSSSQSVLCSQAQSMRSASTTEG